MKFARIINLENNIQVLLTLDYDSAEEEAPFLVTQRTDINGAAASMVLHFETEERAKEVLEAYSEENAKDFRKAIVDVLFSDEEE